jgi:hypothetical protein
MMARTANGVVYRKEDIDQASKLKASTVHSGIKVNPIRSLNTKAV